PAQPAVVRARAMARARAALAAGIVVAPVEPPLLARSPWVASVALACAVSAAVNVAAYQIHAHYARTSAPVTEPAVPARAPVVPGTKAPAARAIVAPIDAAMLASKVTSPARGKRVSDQSELRLLSQARAAVARTD